ncbi:hypothetical protein LguiA_033555 [Lonicera macranthoides]
MRLIICSFLGLMEGGESIFDEIFEEENLDVEDVDMLDVEEGELVEQNSQIATGQNSAGDVNKENQDSGNKNRRRRNKKKNKRKKGYSGPNVTDINRFVLDVCKRLKEKKSYLVWTAVACLGVSALSDLVKEEGSVLWCEKCGEKGASGGVVLLILFCCLLHWSIQIDIKGSGVSFAVSITWRWILCLKLKLMWPVDAIQACGGQKTADGRRFRTGGGILWGILKVRDPNVYKEIMKKGNEFEKQFSKQNNMKTPTKNRETTTTSQGIVIPSKDHTTTSTTTTVSILDGSDDIPPVAQNQVEQRSDNEGKRAPVHDRIRVPVAYDDDLLGAEDPKEIAEVWILAKELTY